MNLIYDYISAKGESKSRLFNPDLLTIKKAVENLLKKIFVEYCGELWGNAIFTVAYL